MVPVLAKNAVRIKCNFQNAGMTGNYECAYALGILNAQLGLPEITEYEDIVDTVKAELKECIDLVKVAGVPDDKIIIDPGIGFAKTVEGNIELMQRVSELHDLGYPILLGVSKKGSIGHLLGGLDVNNRTEGTMAATCFAVSQEVEIVRVHDVLENSRAAKVMQTLLNYV